MKIIFNSHKCGGGFFSQFNLVVQGLVQHDGNIDCVEWDMQDAGAFQYNSGEIYKPLFEEYTNNKEYTETITVNNFYDQNYTAHLAASKYTSSDQKQWRNTYHSIYTKYIKHTDYLNDIFNNVYSEQFARYNDTPKVGILIRNNNLAAEQPRQAVPTNELYIRAISELNLKDFTLICAIDNRQDLEFYKRNYNTICNENTSRSETRYHGEAHCVSNLTKIDAAYHYLEGFALSKCDYLIHPVSNVATAALYMNPKLKNMFVIG